ncbi:MAG: hypothetical protein HW390_3165 [Candidatus Brocadiaceae bacterium]|nr:hypothetical protein [Candidatus Brocadiaceae bacterium]
MLDFALQPDLTVCVAWAKSACQFLCLYLYGMMTIKQKSLWEQWDIDIIHDEKIKETVHALFNRIENLAAGIRDLQ